MKLSEQDGSKIMSHSGSDEDEDGINGISWKNRQKKPRNEDVVKYRDYSKCISDYECVSAGVNSVSSSQELVRGKLG